MNHYYKLVDYIFNRTPNGWFDSGSAYRTFPPVWDL